MAPRGYDRYMVVVGAGRNRKFVRFTDAERCAHFLGVLSIAAQSPIRGCLLVSDGEEAGAEEIASEAAVTLRAARSAIDKLKRVGVLTRDTEASAWRVRDWDEINPPPGSSTERVRRYRASQRNADATPDETASVSKPLHGPLPEVEEEVETPPSTTSQKVTRRRAPRKRPDPDSLPSMPGELHHAAHAVHPILHGTWGQRGGIEPTLRSVGLAVVAFPDRDHQAVARDVEYWLIAGNGREADCGDVVQRYRRFLRSTPASSPTRPSPNGVVRPLRPDNADALIRKLRAAEEAS